MVSLSDANAEKWPSLFNQIALVTTELTAD